MSNELPPNRLTHLFSESEQGVETVTFAGTDSPDDTVSLAARKMVVLTTAENDHE